MLAATSPDGIVQPASIRELAPGTFVALTALQAESFLIDDRPSADAWMAQCAEWRAAIDALLNLPEPREYMQLLASRDRPSAEGAVLHFGWVATGRGATPGEAVARAFAAGHDLHVILESCLRRVRIRPAPESVLAEFVATLDARHQYIFHRRPWVPQLGVAAGTRRRDGIPSAGVLLPWGLEPVPWAPLAEALARVPAPGGLVIRVRTGMHPQPGHPSWQAAYDDLRQLASAEGEVLGMHPDEMVPLGGVADALKAAAIDRLLVLGSRCFALEPVLCVGSPAGAALRAMVTSALAAPTTVGNVPLPEALVCNTEASAGYAWSPLDESNPGVISGPVEAIALVRTVEAPTDESSPLSCSRARVLPLRAVTRDGIIIGYASRDGHLADIHFAPPTRFQHTYVVGQTGTGKSTLLLNLIEQDVVAGHGVTVLDPHGTLIRDVLDRIPPHRARDVIIVDPSDSDGAVGLNALAVDADDAASYQIARDLVIDELFDTIAGLYDMRLVGGPIFEHYFRTFMGLVLGTRRPTEYVPILPMLGEVMSSKALAKRLATLLGDDDPIARRALDAIYEARGDAGLESIVPYIVSKLTRFYGPVLARRLLCQPRGLDFGRILARRQILLVELSRARVGAEAAVLIGRQIVSRLAGAAMRRPPSPDAPEHFIYVDEFHNFATEHFAQLLAEARKYRIGLVLAHQYTSQLVRDGNRQVLDAVLGNIGTAVMFRVGIADAELLEGLVRPRASASDIAGLPNYMAVVRSTGLGSIPFSLTTVAPRPPEHRLERAIREASAQTYRRSRQDIDEEIATQLAAFRGLAG